jgi:hypothetical protein
MAPRQAQARQSRASQGSRNEKRVFLLAPGDNNENGEVGYPGGRRGRLVSNSPLYSVFISITVPTPAKDKEKEKEKTMVPF